MDRTVRLRWATGPREGTTTGLHQSVLKYLSPYTVLDHPAPVTRGPRHLEYHFYQALVQLDMLKNVKEAETLGYDGVVIGCFYDPGLREAREIVHNMVVTAPAESSMHIASTLGHRFSIIVGRQKWIPKMYENVVNYGFRDKLASFRSVDLWVPEFHTREEEAVQRIRREAQSAIKDDGAEVIILGCTMQYGFFEPLQEELGVPVIDAAVAAVKYAEFLANLRKVAGWSHSKIGDYESPPDREIKDWNLTKDYGLGKLWE